MKYVDSILGKDEYIVFETRLHWIIYVVGVFLLISSFVLLAAAKNVPENEVLALLLFAVIAFAVGVFLLIRAFIDVWTTEIATTNRRVIFKRGLIARNTIELSLNNVEGVQVKQTILGRLLRYGTVNVHGTGTGVQSIHYVGRPVDFKRAAFGLT